MTDDDATDALTMAAWCEGKSDWLTQHDCEPPITLTIAAIERAVVEDKTRRSRDHKLVVRWVEDVKPWIPCTTDRRAMREMIGAETPRDFLGLRLTLRRDASVEFGGERTGGIRIMGSPDIPGKVVTVKNGNRRRPLEINMQHTTAPDALASACEARGIPLAALSAEVRAQTGVVRARTAHALRHMPEERAAALRARTTTTTNEE